jgi:hypothetical protein
MKYRPILIFENGSLAVKRSGFGNNNGDGVLGFNDDDLQYEQHTDKEGSYRYINLPHSELVAIRDFLIAELALVEACDCGSVSRRI